jgi:hypothetical protein
MKNKPVNYKNLIQKTLPREKNYFEKKSIQIGLRSVSRLQHEKPNEFSCFALHQTLISQRSQSSILPS